MRGERLTGYCIVCGDPFDRRRRNAEGRVIGANPKTATCERHRSIRKASGLILIDKTTRYENDVACQLFVSVFAGGATLEAIAEAIGVSRERVRQIEEEAIRKLRAAGLSAFDLEPGELAARPRHDVRGEVDEEQDEEADDADDLGDDAGVGDPEDGDRGPGDPASADVDPDGAPDPAPERADAD